MFEIFSIFFGLAFDNNDGGNNIIEGNRVKRKAVFLDRDGTINLDKGYVFRKEDFEFLEGSIEGMKKFSKAGYDLIVLSNQSGIARGYFKEAEYLNLEKWFVKELSKHGITLKAIYYCPHLPSAMIPKYRIQCDCRKPKLGMFERAIRENNIELSESIAIGDKMRDLEICKNGFTKGICVYAEYEHYDARQKIHFIKGGILQAADFYCK